MIEIKFGNHKLGDDTAIFNITPADTCPSKQIGLCQVIKKGITCYAAKAERTYKFVRDYRQRQQDYWRNSDATTIIRDIVRKIKARRKETRYLRFNESGDFIDQSDIDKLSAVAEGLKELGITTYGYTARSDLDFRPAKFLVKGSGHDKGNTGTCTVIRKHEPVPEGYIECPGSCKRCNLCKINVVHNIAFRQH